MKHRCYKSDYGPGNISFDHIGNYSYEKVGTQDYFEETRNVYQYEYDEYSDTLLVTLIDRLLKGDMSAISEIKDPKEEKKKEYDQGKELQKRLEKLISLDAKDINTWQLEKVKKELEAYQIDERLNRDRESDLKYYSQVLSCIEMKEVRRMKLDHIIKTDELMRQADSLLAQTHIFFEGNDPQNISVTQYQNVIQKIYQ